MSARATADSAPDTGPQVRAYARAVWKRRWLILALLAAGAAAAFVYGRSVDDVFSVATRIDIAKQRPFGVGPTGTNVISFGEGYMESQLYYPTRYKLLPSPTYVRALLRPKETRAGRRYPVWDWLTWPASGGRAPMADQEPYKGENLGASIDAADFRILTGLEPEEFRARFRFRAYGPEPRPPDAPFADPADLEPFLVGRTAVEPEKGTTLVDITLEGERRDLLAPLLNLLIEVFSREQRSESQRRLEKERGFWEERRSDLTSVNPRAPAGSSPLEPGRLQTAEKALEDWKDDNRLDAAVLEQQRTSLGNALTESDRQVREVSDRLAAAYASMDGVIDRRGIEAKVRAEATATPEASKDAERAVDVAWNAALLDAARRWESVNAAADDKDVAILRLPLVTADREFAKVTADLESGPRDSLGSVTLDRLRQQRMRIARDLVLQAIETWRKDLGLRVALRDRRARDYVQFGETWRLKNELDGRQAYVDRLRGELRDVDDRLRNIDSQIDVERDLKPLRVIEAATDPGRPVRPDRPLLVVVGAALGLFLGFCLALLLEWLDDTVTDPEDVLRHVGAPVFGTLLALPSRADGAADRVATEQPRSPAAEAYRALRTAVEFTGTDVAGGRTLLVSSCSPREGKTTVALNLAAVLAQDGKRTLLVDADLRKPRIHRVLDLDGAVGLSNVIAGRARLEDAIQSTSQEGLFVLPCGALPPNPAELLGRAATVTCLARLRGEFDRIVIDSPPVGVVTDAAVLARLADVVLLVVASGRTKKKAAEHGASVLRAVGAEPDGAVLNFVRRGSGWLYAAYYDSDAAGYYSNESASSESTSSKTAGTGTSA